MNKLISQMHNINKTGVSQATKREVLNDIIRKND